MRIQAVGAILLLSMTACSAPAASTATSPSSIAAPSDAASPSATISTATENEVASIMAGYMSEATKTIEGAGDCRMLSVTAKSAADEAMLVACYTNEVTLGTSSTTTAKKLRELTPPASMETIVDDTTAVLDEVSGIDLEKSCGPAMGRPRGTKACDTAMGDRYGAYLRLKEVLASWSPYVS